MKSILSIRYKDWQFNFALLILRCVAGALIIAKGYDKLKNFSQYKSKFMDFMGLGSSISLSLVVFAEFFCGIFIVLGLFTRLAAIPLIIAMSVAFFMAHNGRFFGDGENSVFFLAVFASILLVGPGRYSVDGMIKN